MSDFWYDKEIYTTIITKGQSNTGQVIKGYKKDTLFMGDIQPIGEKSRKYTWGDGVQSKLELYCDELLKVNDIVIYNDIAYKIEERMLWDDYGIYALLESDVTVL